MLSNVSLSVGAPVRVNLYSLVRRLLYSHLTPSTISSPTLPPSSVLQCTPILTLPLLLPHCSMGENVWCYDQCMSAACPDRLLRLSLSSLFLLGQLRLGDTLTHHLKKMTTPAEEVRVEAGRAQCTNTLICSLDQCVFVPLEYLAAQT